MKRTIASLLAAGLLGLAGPAAAQVQGNEFSVFGAWDDVDEPENVETLTLYARYGLYVRPRLLATAAVSRTSFETNTVDSSTTSFLVGAKYYFGEARPQAVIPFVDAAIGVADTDTGRNSGTDLTWEFGGGAALFFTERTSVDAAVRLYYTDTDSRTQGIRFFVGMTTRF